MLSEAGFRMHLDNVQHSTNMHNTHGGVANLNSVVNSKTVLLNAFLEQQAEIARLKRIIVLKE